MKKAVSKSMAWFLSMVMLFGVFLVSNAAELKVRAANDSNILAHLDAIYVEDNAVFVKGWAFDNDAVSQSVDIHVYIGGKAGNSNAELHVIKADKLRKDVNDAHNCGNYHGFMEAISTSKRGNQAVYVYAINLGAGSANPIIGSATLTI